MQVPSSVDALGMRRELARFMFYAPILCTVEFSGLLLFPSTDKDRHAFDFRYESLISIAWPRFGNLALCVVRLDTTTGVRLFCA